MLNRYSHCEEVNGLRMNKLLSSFSEYYNNVFEAMSMNSTEIPQRYKDIEKSIIQIRQNEWKLYKKNSIPM